MITKLTAEQRKHIGDRRIVASVSGGKDSTALCLWLMENDIEFDRVFLNTQWENQVTYGYLEHTLPKYIGEITWVQGPLSMVELIRKKKMFPSRLTRFCTEELKVKPMIEYFSKRLDLGEDCINVVGIRWAESKERAKMVEWEWNKGFDVETWRPLLQWTEQDVIDMIRKYDVPPNPLYLEGASRVGCWPCIFARKDEVKFLAKHDPKRIQEIADLEKEMSDGARQRAEAKGSTKWRAPTFFQGKEVDENGKGIGIPIDKVVEWSKTARGGRQFELIENAPEGCVRWGLCDRGKGSDEE